MRALAIMGAPYRRQRTSNLTRRCRRSTSPSSTASISRSWRSATTRSSAAIETSLAAQGRGQTVIEPRVHLAPGQSNGHFNVLRGAINAPVDRAGIKVVGDFVDNYKLGFPSELGVVLLLDPRTGAPQAILDGAGITDMRTGAMTAVGAKYLARKNSQGARPYRRARLGLLERAPARPPVRLRRDPRPFQAGRKAATPSPQRLRTRPRQEGHRRPTTGAPASKAPTSWSRPRG